MNYGDIITSNADIIKYVFARLFKYIYKLHLPPPKCDIKILESNHFHTSHLH